MKYAVIKGNKFTGTAYDEINEAIINHHTSQGEILVPVETPPEPVSIENGMSIYGDADIEVLKRGKLWQLADNRWREETAGFIYNEHEFHSDRESQNRFFQAYVASLNDPSFAVTWKTKDGWLEMNAEDFVELYNNFWGFLQGLYQKEKALQEQVKVATTIEEIEAIKW